MLIMPFYRTPRVQMDLPSSRLISIEMSNPGYEWEMDGWSSTYWGAVGALAPPLIAEGCPLRLCGFGDVITGLEYVQPRVTTLIPR